MFLNDPRPKQGARNFSKIPDLNPVADPGARTKPAHRADAAIASNAHIRMDDGHRMDDSVLADGNTGINKGGRRINDRHPS